MAKDSIQHFDICIMGAGMVGAASACAMAKQGYSVAIVEPFMPEAFESKQNPDIRVSALNRHSLDLLDELGALTSIKEMRYRQYDTLMVWESENAKSTFSAKDVGENTLGIFAENRIIQLALLKSMQSTYASAITLFEEKADEIDTSKGIVRLNKDTHIRAKLIIGADGARSQARQSAGIGQTGWDYAQRANVILIKLHKAIPDTTWQQFTPDGPLALLPMHDNFATLVWYANAQTSTDIQNSDNDTLKQKIVSTFPPLLENFDIVDAARFGLSRMHANQYYSDKLVIVGDAAHTINPLAGQGVNLGFKDVSALSDAIKKHGLAPLEQTLSAYEKARRTQNLLMMSTMDALYGVFSNDILPIKVIRNIALGAANKAGPIKNMALKYAMGI